LSLQAVADTAFQIAEQAIPDFLSRYNPWSEIQVEEGSKKLKSRFLAAATAFALYGGIRATIDYGVNDAKAVAGWVNGQLRDRFNLGRRELIRQERRAGFFGRLQRLLNAVEAGSMTPQQATEKAAELLFESGFTEALASPILGQFREELGAMPARLPTPRPQRHHVVSVTYDALPSRGSRGIIVWRDPNTGQRRQRAL
jgi:hypothetical protein